MTRIAVGLEYQGTRYAGWQSQSTAETVQALAESALAKVADEAVSLVCAGRTDAGVHARGQVAHFDTAAGRSMRAWMLGANSELPRDVSISWVRPVPQHFHARYSAEARTYRYLIFNRASRSGLLAHRATWVHRPLDAEQMAQGAAALEGEHDFSAFRAAECQARSPIRRMERLTVTRQGDWLVIDATANAFLHHMVRNIAGSLLEVGRGERPRGWIGELLAARDRNLAGATAMPQGLTFVGPRYPPRWGLPPQVL